MHLVQVSIEYLGSEAPFERMQPALMLYVKEDLLQGKEPSHENINVRFRIDFTVWSWPYFQPLSIS